MVYCGITIAQQSHKLTRGVWKASPISAGGGEAHSVSQYDKKSAHEMAFRLRKIHAHF